MVFDKIPANSFIGFSKADYPVIFQVAAPFFRRTMVMAIVSNNSQLTWNSSLFGTPVCADEVLMGLPSVTISWQRHDLFGQSKHLHRELKPRNWGWCGLLKQNCWHAVNRL